MRHPNRRVGFVDVLTTGPAGAKGVNAHIGRVDRDRLRFVRLWHHRHGAGTGVYATLRLGGWHPLHPVPTRFKLQAAIDPLARDPNHHLFVPPQLTGGLTQQLGAPTLAVGVAQIHAQQVAGKQGRFIATRPGPDFHKRRSFIVRVARQQHALQLTAQALATQLGRCLLVLRHLAHVLFQSRVFQHLATVLQVGLGLLIRLPTLDHGGDLGVFARQLHEALDVAHDVRAGQQKIKFCQSLGMALQLGAQKGLQDDPLS